MARGNQRDKAREKNQKEAAGQVRYSPLPFSPSPLFPSSGNVWFLTVPLEQKKKNNQSGTEFARTKEAQAAIMREKQAAAANKKDGAAAGSSSKK